MMQHILKEESGKVIGIILLVLIILVVLFIAGPGLFSSEPRKIVKAIHQYHDSHGRWPDKLEQLRPQFLAADVDLKSTFRTYIYMHNNTMFVLSYHEGLEQGEYYRSDTKEYTAMQYHPRDPGYKSYKELKINPVCVDVPSKYRERRSTE